MMDNQDMKTVMTIFAEKILMNLVYSTHEEEDSMRIIDTTLDVFQFYTGAISSCRMIANTDAMA